jgi:hypothetical protein
VGFTVTVRVGAKVIVAVGKIVGSGVFVSTGFSSIVGATVETNVAVGLHAANKITAKREIFLNHTDDFAIVSYFQIFFIYINLYQSELLIIASINSHTEPAKVNASADHTDLAFRVFANLCLAVHHLSAFGACVGNDTVINLFFRKTPIPVR